MRTIESTEIKLAWVDGDGYNSDEIEFWLDDYESKENFLNGIQSFNLNPEYGYFDNWTNDLDGWIDNGMTAVEIDPFLFEAISADLDLSAAWVYHEYCTSGDASVEDFKNRYIGSFYDAERGAEEILKTLTDPFILSMVDYKKAVEILQADYYFHEGFGSFCYIFRK